MLNPNNNRLDYGQILAPPDQYRLDFAIGTTYSLDLDALVGACIALGLSEETDSTLMQNPICLLEALRMTGDKIAMFCEGGQIYLPNNITSLYILLEKIVFQVSTEKCAGITKYPSFHPKFWLIRYVDESGNPSYRVVVLSRNLTFDRSWDVTFAMDGKKGKRKTQKTLPVSDFISYLTESLPSDENAKEKLKKIKTILRELPYVHFELNSKEFSDFEFLPMGVESSAGGIYSAKHPGFGPLFQEEFQELLVMSPFLTNSVLKELVGRNQSGKTATSMLFTRTASLGKLKAKDCETFRIFTMKDAVIDGESMISEDESESVQKQEIHAKIYMVRRDLDSYLYLGSMNASHNAIYGNVEFMVRLKSKRQHLNLQNLSEDFFNGKEDGKENPFCEVFLTEQIVADEEQELQNSLEHAVKEISRMKPSAKVVCNGEKYDLILHFENYQPLELPVIISPLLSNKTEKLSETIIFSSLDVTQISQFFKVAITDKDGVKTLHRVMLVPTEGIPQERERAIISGIVKNKECFYRYISFLLGDSHVLSSLESENGLTIERQHEAGKTIQLPVLYEKMLNTAATAPEKFKEIEYLLQALSEDGVIPEQFEELYNVFKKVVKLS